MSNITAISHAEGPSAGFIVLHVPPHRLSTKNAPGPRSSRQESRRSFTCVTTPSHQTFISHTLLETWASPQRNSISLTSFENGNYEKAKLRSCESHVAECLKFWTESSFRFWIFEILLIFAKSSMMIEVRIHVTDWITSLLINWFFFFTALGSPIQGDCRRDWRSKENNVVNMIRFLFAKIFADNNNPHFFVIVRCLFRLIFRSTKTLYSLPTPLQVPKIYALIFSNSTRPGSFLRGELQNFSSCIWRNKRMHPLVKMKVKSRASLNHEPCDS